MKIKTKPSDDRVFHQQSGTCKVIYNKNMFDHKVSEDKSATSYSTWGLAIK